VPFLFQIGHATAADLGHDFGHIACTLAGINYESRGSKGVIKNLTARGATNPLFVNHFHLVLSDEQARRALRYANACTGQPYRLGQVPTRHRGGDCSGLISGIIRRARGHELERLFTTANFLDRADDLGFSAGLGGGVIESSLISSFARANRPFPGRVIDQDERRGSPHTKWIQARLNFAVRSGNLTLPHLLREDGDFDPATVAAVKAFQGANVRTVTGQVGRVTWRRLNSLR
jgi:peptidoglycan hydrolase-like protein with peptidoglycan-binding domain